MYKPKEIIFLCQTPTIHFKFDGWDSPPDNKSYTDEPKREYMKVPLELTESSCTELEQCLEEADKSCKLEATLEESTIMFIKSLIWIRSNGYEWDSETEKAAKLKWPHIFF